MSEKNQSSREQNFPVGGMFPENPNAEQLGELRDPPQPSQPTRKTKKNSHLKLDILSGLGHFTDGTAYFG